MATCTLVCKQWHRLVTSEPELLHEVAAAVGRHGIASIRSLYRFLRQVAAPHLHSLELRVTVPASSRLRGPEGLMKELENALAKCNGGHQLSELRVTANFPLTLGAWLRPLACSLRRLQVLAVSNSNYIEETTEGLPACTQLEQLLLDGTALWEELPPSSLWPASITSLAWNSRFAIHLPAQVRPQCSWARGSSGWVSTARVWGAILWLELRLPTTALAGHERPLWPAAQDAGHGPHLPAALAPGLVRRLAASGS